MTTNLSSKVKKCTSKDNIRLSFRQISKTHEESKQFNYKLLSPSDFDSKAKRISAYDNIFKREVQMDGHFQRKCLV